MDLNDLLSLETSELLKFKFTDSDLLIWPFVRYQIFTEIQRKQNYYSKDRANKEKQKISDIISYIITSIIRAPLKNRNFEIVFFSATLDNTFTVNGKYFNRVHDYFALEYQDLTLIIEESGRRSYRLPRYFKNWCSGDIVKIIGSIHAKIDIFNNNIADIDNFMQYIEYKFANYLSNYDFKKLRNNLLNIKKKIKYYRKYYGIILKKIKPKIIFINCASYGGMNACLIKLSKEMNIKVGEFQHGLVSSQHAAYNYSWAVLNSSEYGKYLPDFLLTYGEYWNQQISIPVAKIAIGCPHYNAMLKRFYKNKENNINKHILNILIISQGTVTNRFVNIAKYLYERLDSSTYRIIFRLHPGEVPFTERYKELCDKPGLTISKSGDIYDLIFKSDFIVAYNSTSIFESIGFNKPIFILDDDSTKLDIPHDIGIRFKDAYELSEQIESIKVTIKSSEEEYENYWKSDWRESYHKFISSILT